MIRVEEQGRLKTNPDIFVIYAVHTLSSLQANPNTLVRSA